MDSQPQKPDGQESTRRLIKRLWVVLAVASVITVALFALPERHVPDSDPSPLVPSLGVADAGAFSNLSLRRQKNHPVTARMSKAAASLGAKAAPPFSLMDLNGEVQTLADLSSTRPLLIFFVEKECPCCVGAKYYVDKIADLYGSELNAVGIINADGRIASAWSQATRPKFAILQDPKMGVIRSYKAERGVYTTLVAPGGRIDKAYAGYSQEMLKDLSRRIAKLAHIQERTVYAPSAPKTLTSGCPFPDPDTKENAS